MPIGLPASAGRGLCGKMRGGVSAACESAARQGPRPAGLGVQSAGRHLPQGVILVYDIANRWSFDGIDRWIKEIDEVRLRMCARAPSAWAGGCWAGAGLGTRLPQQGGCVGCQRSRGHPDQHSSQWGRGVAGTKPAASVSRSCWDNSP